MSGPGRGSGGSGRGRGRGRRRDGEGGRGRGRGRGRSFSRDRAPTKPSASREQDSEPRGKKDNATDQLSLKRPRAAPVEEDEAFPRGGGETLTPLERKMVEAEARAEFEQEVAAGKQPKAKKKRRDHKGDDDEDAEAAAFARELRVSGAATRDGTEKGFVELLRARHLSVGCRIWGMVLSVTSREVEVSLPNGLRGRIVPTEASDVLAMMLDPDSSKGAQLLAAAGGMAPSLPELFAVGQFLRCVVLSLPGQAPSKQKGKKSGKEDEQSDGKKAKKHMMLSCLLSRLQGGSGGEALLTQGAVVGACVRSVEDHGYVLSMGAKSARGFLRRKDHEVAYGAGAALQVGQMLDVVVKSAADKRQVQVSSAGADVVGALSTEVPGLELGALMPGALVNIHVRKVLSDGLVVSFMTFFNGTIDLVHIPRPSNDKGGSKDWAKTYTEGRKLKARIIFVDPGEKKVRLSLLPHLISMNLAGNLPLLGELIENCKIARVDPRVGLLLDVPVGSAAGNGEAAVATSSSTDSICPGYVHISNVSDEEVEKLEGSYKMGQSVQARVIGFRLMDGCATLSMKPSLLAQNIMSYADLVPGMVVEVTVDRVTDDSHVVVHVTKSIVGLIQALHATDSVTGKRPKLKAGDKLRARVLEVEPRERRLKLTLRKALLMSKQAPLVTLEQAARGAKFHGMVSGVTAKGVFITFYSGLSGLAPPSELGLTQQQQPSEVYKLGMIVKATIMGTSSGNRLRLSLASKATQAADAAAATSTKAAAASSGTDMCGGLQPGEVLDALVQSVQSQAREGGAEGVSDVVAYLCALRREDGSVVEGLLARLEPQHLSDHPAAVKTLMEVVKPGAQLGSVVVLERIESAKPPTPSVRISRKASLLAAARPGGGPGLPAAFSDVRDSALLPGYVANVTNDAVYVRFLGGLTGRAGLAQLADQFVSDPRLLFSEGQSVQAAVVTRDAAKQRFSLSLRPSATTAASASGAAAAAYLHCLFKDLELAESLRDASEGDATEPSIPWSQAFAIGAGLICGTVSQLEEYGVLIDLDGHPDVVGLVPQAHVQSATSAAAAEAGSSPASADASSSKALAAKHQLSPGAHISGVVIDVSKDSGIVELSLKPELLAGRAASSSTAEPGPGSAAAAAAAAKGIKGTPKGATKAKAVKNGDWTGLACMRAEAVSALKPGGVHEAVVEGVRDDRYAILSFPLPGGPPSTRAIGFASLTDYNACTLAAVKQHFKAGDTVSAVLSALPSEANGGRLILSMALHKNMDAGVSGNKGAAAKNGEKGQGPRATSGALVKVTITSVHPDHLEVSLGKKGSGHIHATEAVELPKPKQPSKAGAKDESSACKAMLAALPKGSPLEIYRPQQVVEAVVLGKLSGPAGHRTGALEFSLRPSRLAAARAAAAKDAKDAPAVADKSKKTGADAGAEGEGAKATTLNAPTPQYASVHGVEGLKPGMCVAGVISEVDLESDAIWVSIAPHARGRVSMLDLSDDPSGLSEKAAALKPGQFVLARVLAVAQKKHQLDLSLVEPGRGDARGSAGELPAGSLAIGKVLETSGSGVRIQLSHKRVGRAALTDLHDAWVPNALKGIKEGMFVRAHIEKYDGERAVLSLRPSKGGIIPGVHKSAVAGASSSTSCPAGDLDLGALKKGALLSGYVKRAEKSGVFIMLDRDVTGRIKMGNMSDGFVEDVSAAFPVGLRVEGARVLAVQQQEARVELSLRAAKRPSASLSSIQSVEDLSVGQVVNCSVKRVEKYGLFCWVEGSRQVVGLAHISELRDGPVKDITTDYKPKDPLRCVVTKIDDDTKRLSLSAKPSTLKEALAAAAAEAATDGKPASKKRRTGAGAVQDLDSILADMVDGEDDEGSEDEEAASSEEEDAESGASSEDEEGSEGEESDDSEEAEGSDDEDVAVDDVEGSSDEAMSEDGSEAASSASEDEDEEPHDRPGETSSHGRSASGPFSAGWGELALEDDGGGAGDGNGDDEEEEGKLSKGARKRMQKEKEAAIRQAELARLSGDAAPQTTEDFERLVLASPNSSFVWIKYMALHLGLGDVAKARAVAERALKTINYREEGEKFNIWVAWLNLENAYGSPNPEDAAMELLHKALQYNDHKKLYLAALGIFSGSGRAELSEQVLKTMTKKFNTSCKVWMKAVEAALAKDPQGEGARALLERSLQLLPRRKHLKMLSRAGLAEFKQGSAERGRSIFEGILRNYPKRLDLWSVYIDQEVKTGEQARIRSLFERATHLSLPPKKMRFLFRRWLEYEKAHGDDASASHVKRRAMEFVEGAVNA